MTVVHAYRLGAILRRFRPGTLATTFGWLVVLWATPALTTLRHEEVHVWQAAEFIPRWWPRWLEWMWMVNVPFLVAYLRIYRRTGYENHPWEIEARKAAGE